MSILKTRLRLVLNSLYLHCVFIACFCADPHSLAPCSALPEIIAVHQFGDQAHPALVRNSPWRERSAAAAFGFGVTPFTHSLLSMKKPHAEQRVLWSFTASTRWVMLTHHSAAKTGGFRAPPLIVLRISERAECIHIPRLPFAC